MLSYFYFEKKIYFLFWSFLGLCFFSSFRGSSTIEKHFVLKDRKQKMTRAVEMLETHNHELEKLVAKISRSEVYAKKVLKDKYHMTEEGERLVYFK